MRLLFFFRYLFLLAVVGCSGFSVESFLVETPGNKLADKNIYSLPIKVYLLKFEGSPEFDSIRNPSVVKEVLFPGINQIWDQAGIQWEIVSVEPLGVPRSLIDDVSSLTTDQLFRAAMTKVVPESTSDRIWTLFIMKKFPVQHGGLYIRETKTAIFGDTAGEVSQKLLPHIAAHELAHSLNISQHSDEINNIVSTSKPDFEKPIEILEEQQRIARKQALIGPVGN